MLFRSLSNGRYPNPAVCNDGILRFGEHARTTMSRRAKSQEGEGDVEEEPDRHKEKQNGLLSRWVSGESLGKSFLSSLLSRTNMTGNGGVLPENMQESLYMISRL